MSPKALPAVARYNADGSLDTTFNPGGALPGTETTSFGASFTAPTSVCPVSVEAVASPRPT